jgi:hypothetical protein
MSLYSYRNRDEVHRGYFFTLYTTRISASRPQTPQNVPIRRKVCSEELLSVNPGFVQVGQFLDLLEYHSSETIDTISHEIG